VLDRRGTVNSRQYHITENISSAGIFRVIKTVHDGLDMQNEWGNEKHVHSFS
jgi:hypothetical protein